MSLMSKAMLERQSVHHLVMGLLRVAFSGFVVGNHAQGGTIPLLCKMVGTQNRNERQGGWIDSPGVALQLLKSYKLGAPEGLPRLSLVDIHNPETAFRVDGAAPVYRAEYRLHYQVANAFDAIDLQSQLTDYFRGVRNKSLVDTKLIGEAAYLSDKDNLPQLKVRVTTDQVYQSQRDDSVVGYLDITADYDLRPVVVNYALLVQLGYIINPPTGVTPPYGGGSQDGQPGIPEQWPSGPTPILTFDTVMREEDHHDTQEEL